MNEFLMYYDSYQVRYERVMELARVNHTWHQMVPTLENALVLPSIVGG